MPTIQEMVLCSVTITDYHNYEISNGLSLYGFIISVSKFPHIRILKKLKAFIKHISACRRQNVNKLHTHSLYLICQGIR